MNDYAFDDEPDLTIKPASELEVGDVTVLGEVTAVEEVEAEYAGEKPIGADPEYLITFDDTDTQRFQNWEPFSVEER